VVDLPPLVTIESLTATNTFSYLEMRREPVNNSTSEIKLVFQFYDPENKGYISKETLCRIMTSIGEKLNREELDKLMEEGIGQNGKFNYNDFVKILAK
jgi:Ca2+-binding EF-hand superfamily protein